MKKTILNNRKLFIYSLFAAIVGFTVVPKTFAGDDVKNVFDNVQVINDATAFIQNGKYKEASELLNGIKDESFFFVKNLHLGDIAFKQEHYQDALTFYKLAQINSKDKIMYEYMAKKIAYIQTVKLAKTS